ncbi:MAG: hypothetical protein ACLP8S_28805 [Solirubrobacteraceae bacterium]
MNDDQQLPEAELARLADGSLPASRSRELCAQAEASPELAAALDEQRRAVSLLRAIDVPAPPSLRAKVEAMTGPAARVAARRPPSRFALPSRFAPPSRLARALGVPIVAALVIVVAAIVVAQGRVASAPTVPQTARLTLAAATLPPPAVDPAHPGQLQLRVGGIAFPSWYASAQLSTAGARVDTLRGRRIVTVFYSGAARRVGYAIVSGPPLRQVRGLSVTRDGVRFTLARAGSANLVTWVRAGHTCVIAGTLVSFRTLLGLAAYQR